MMIPEIVSAGKDESVVELCAQLHEYVQNAAAEGECLHTVEQTVFGTVLELGKKCIDTFIALQGNGDRYRCVRRRHYAK